MSTAEPDEPRPAVVVDAGSGVLKAGFAGDDGPRVCFPSLVGSPKAGIAAKDETGTPKHQPMAGLSLKERYVGSEAQKRRGMLSLRWPVEEGVVRDWDDMELLLRDAFGQLTVGASDQPLLISDNPLNPTANREKMAELMFEKFEVPAFYVMTSSVLSIFASGRHMGVIVDSGDGVTHVMPIEGLFIRPHSTQRINLAGRSLTAYLQRLMMERNYSMADSGMEVAREAKENLCYVATDYDSEMTAAQNSDAVERSYTLPDGQVISLNDQRFRVPEALFKPSLLGKDTEGIHEMVCKSIMKCDMDVRSMFFSNIILCGGSTMFPGFGTRLGQEVGALAPQSARIRVVEPPERKYSVWIGGSIVASLSTFQQSWVTRAEYTEHGPAILHRKCS